MGSALAGATEALGAEADRAAPLARGSAARAGTRASASRSAETSAADRSRRRSPSGDDDDVR